MQRHRRPVFEVAAGGGQIGARARSVAARRRREVEQRRAARQAFDLLDRLEQRAASPAADVVGRLGPALGGRDRGRDDVGDEGEVAHLASIAEDAKRLAEEDGANEGRERHLRPLTRAVGGEVAQRDGRKPVHTPVDVDELLARGLRHPVGRHRGERIGLSRRPAVDVAVHRRRRREDEPRRYRRGGSLRAAAAWPTRLRCA